MLQVQSNPSHRITLSRQEMCIISQVISRDFSPQLFVSRVGQQAKNRFSSQELLEISRQISREYAPGKVSHQSRLVLLALSPRRLHVYWDVAKRRLQNALNRIEPEQAMILRIYTQPEPQIIDPQENESGLFSVEPDWFDIDVKQADGQQDILLPETVPVNNLMHYRAVLGQIDDKHIFTPQLYSNTTAAPISMPMQSRIELPNAIAQFIMSANNPASAAGKTASGQGK
ncbi:MAG: DUF4912 domain-containing protein [Methylomonas lenta]|nr:DUF4912 domain-containing protein [Methylomonas lenta]